MRGAAVEARTHSQILRSNHPQEIIHASLRHYKHAAKVFINFLPRELRAQGFLRIGAGEIEGQCSLLRGFSGVAQVDLEDRGGDVGGGGVTGDEGRPGSQTDADRRIGFKLQVGHRIVPPVMNLLGGPHTLERRCFDVGIVTARFEVRVAAIGDVAAPQNLIGG